jgi:predicted nuclease of predicted toxin-antitoxin system
VKFLVDNQLPGALAGLLASFGCDSVHVMDVGLGSAPDAEIWRYACENARIVVTKDEDFLHLANRQLQGGGVIWVRLGNCRTAHLLSRFEQLWSRIKASLEAGDRVIEIR